MFLVIFFSVCANNYENECKVLGDGMNQYKNSSSVLIQAIHEFYPSYT